MNKIIFVLVAILALSCTREQQDDINGKINDLNMKTDSLSNSIDQLNNAFSHQDSINFAILLPYQGNWELTSVIDGNNQDLTDVYGQLYFKVAKDSFYIDYSQKNIKQRGELSMYKNEYEERGIQGSFQKIEVENINTGLVRNYGVELLKMSINSAGNEMSVKKVKDIILGDSNMEFGQDTGIPNNDRFYCFTFRRL